MNTAARILRSLGLVALAALSACGPDEDTLTTSRPSLDIPMLEDLRTGSSGELVDALDAGSLEQRERAALAMGRIQNADSAPALVRAADSRQPRELRRAALFALGQLGLAQGAEPPQEAVAAVHLAIRDRDDAIVARATQALGKLAPEGAAEVLTTLLSHKDPSVRREAAYGLFRTRFVPVWRRQASAPPELPDAAIQALIQALKDADPQVRLAAAHAFSRYGEAEAADALGEALDDSDAWVRLFSARGINRGGIASDAVAASLAKASTEDTSAQVRREAVAALGNVGKPESIPAAARNDPSFHVRAAFATAWASATQDRAMDEALRQMVGDPAPTVRAAALTALARRLGKDSLPDLRGALEDSSWVIRSSAAQALGTIGNLALPAVEKALQDEDLRVQASALDALGQVSDTQEATERIATALAADDLAVRGTAVGLLLQRQHPQRLGWLEQAYANSPGVEWIEIREGVVDALAATEETADDSGEGGSEEGGENAGGNTGKGLSQETAVNDFLYRIAVNDSASSVRDRARNALTARGLAAPEAEPGEPAQPSRFLRAVPPEGLLPMTDAGNPTVVLETSKGTLEILVLADRAPIHAASFLDLVAKGFYDGLIWHRVVPNFVIQGGDPMGNGWGGPGYTLRDEISPGPFLRGSVGMPKAGKDTGGCQIFITHVPTPHLDGNYTIFGQVTLGLEVIDQIEIGDVILEARIRTP